jgi:hypothetical protein
MFFWSYFGQEGAGAGLAMLLGAAGLGLFLILASICGSGLVRGFLQTLFAGAYLGVVLGVFMKMKLPWGAPLDLVEIFKHPIVAGLAAAFLVTVVSCRVKLYHPRKLTPRLFGFLGGAALIALLFVPPTAVGKEGVSLFQAIRDLIGGADLAPFWAIVMASLGAMGLFAVGNILPWRSGLRSRLVLLLGFFVLLSPLVGFLVLVIDKGGDSVILPAVNGTRNFLIGFLVVWVLLVGISSFVANMLVAMNYNDKMLLAKR